MAIEDEIKTVEEIGTALAQMIQLQAGMIKDLQQQVADQKALILQLGENQKQLLTEITLNRYQINAAQDNIYNLVAGTIGYSEDAKRQIFLDMPKAAGKKRIWQLITAETMYELDREAKKAGRPVFLIFGTLLGCLRHHGFIPWDDDIDTAIMDGDFAKLYDFIAKDADSPIRLDITYAPKSFAIQCRAVFKDSVLPGCRAFSDVFPFHYITKDTPESFNKFAEVKGHLTDRFTAINEKYASFLAENPEPPVPVGAMLLDRDLETAGYSDVAIEAAKASRAAIQELIDTGLMVPDSQKYDSQDRHADHFGAESIKYSIYSYRSHGSPLLSVDRVFPLQKAEFEEEYYNVPYDADWVIRHTHGDYLTLPHDIHMSHEDLPQSAEELEAILDTARKIRNN